MRQRNDSGSVLTIAETWQKLGPGEETDYPSLIPGCTDLDPPGEDAAKEPPGPPVTTPASTPGPVSTPPLSSPASSAPANPPAAKAAEPDGKTS